MTSEIVKFLRVLADFRLARMASLALVLMTAVAVASVPAHAQRNRDNEEEERDDDRTISPNVGEPLNEAITAINEEENLPKGLQFLDEALGLRGLSPYETGVLLQLRGNVNYQMERVPAAISDWERALNEGEWRQSERLSLMYNVGQLYFLQEDYRTAVRKLEEWLAAGGEGSTAIHLNLVAAYAELEQLRDALRHARFAYDKMDRSDRTLTKRVYDTLNYLYTELNMPRERAQILQEMVVLFPKEKPVWLSIAALYAQGGQEDRAFEINKIMYLNGMLTTESEILRIVDYYSYLDVPYRGAQILEREMNRGRVERNLENYERLARFYRQSREFDKAVAPLREAARRTNNGERFKELGEAFYAEARLEEAEQAFEQAIDQGNLDKPGAARNLLAAVVYEQGRREEAIEIYEDAKNYDPVRRDAQQWIDFIKAELQQIENRKAFERRVWEEERRVACARIDKTVLQTYIERGVEMGEVNPVLQGVDCRDLLRNPQAYFEANYDRLRALQSGEADDESSAADQSVANEEDEESETDAG